MTLFRAVVILLLSGCGGGGGVCETEPAVPSDAGPGPDAARDPLCDNLGAPCGGDMTGVWDVVAGCAGGEGQLTADCAQSSIRIDTWYARWTGTIAADGALTMSNIEENATGRIFMPLDCVAFQDCDGVEVALSLQGFTASCQAVVDTCAPDGTKPLACDCAASAQMQGGTRMASLRTTGPTTFEMKFGGEVIPGEYCVQNNEMWWHAKRFGNIDYVYRFQRQP